MRDFDWFYLDQNEPNQSCLLALRRLILDQAQQITETKKYGMPCFCYQGKMFCYLWVDKKTSEPYVLFVEGKHLDYPELETGSRSRMKILRINPLEDLPVSLIELILKQALNLYRKTP